jgi:transcriptional regulator with XRE-family HTH domain
VHEQKEWIAMNNNTKDDLGTAIKFARLEKGMTRAELAKKLYITPRHIAHDAGAAQGIEPHALASGRQNRLPHNSEEYAELRSAVLYGIHDGRGDILEVAVSQIGNTGGAPYWSWYGFLAAWSGARPSCRDAPTSAAISTQATVCSFYFYGLLPIHPSSQQIFR